jgi:tetratricopeptide (TPR) repeat protein
VLEARRGDGIRRALDLFGEVLKVDPTFVPAYAGFANATAESSFAEDIPQDQPDSVLRVAALRAIALDPLLAEAQAAMGHVHACAGEWPEAERSFRRALELNPSLTTTYTDFVLSTLLPEGKLDEAMRQLEVALRGDPRSLDVRRVLANVQISAGLYDRALENARTVLAIDPTFPYVGMSGPGPSCSRANGLKH